MTDMPTADEGLLATNWPGLNEQFYQSDPYDYFLTRLQLFMLFAGRTEDLAFLINEGIEFGKVRMGGEGIDREALEPSEDDVALRKRFLAAESEVLLHHTVETLLRLYLAHEGLRGCPWLELSRLRYDFPKAVRGRFGPSGPTPDEGRAFSAPVVLGRTISEDSGDDLVLAVDHTEHSLRTFAAVFTEGANRYNAAKHGLSVVPVEAASLAISPAAEDVGSLRVDGPAIHFLEKTKEPPRWQLTTAWIDIERNLALQYVATLLILNIWTVARARYADGPTSGEMLVLPMPVRELLADPSHGPIKSFSRHLAYDLDVRPDLRPG